MQSSEYLFVNCFDEDTVLVAKTKKIILPNFCVVENNLYSFLDYFYNV